MKWFTSDLHHQHSRICEFTNRQLVIAQAKHDDWLVELWNSQVQAGDVCYQLGDLSFAKRYDDIALFVSKLNGQKILIKGNHDKRENLDRLLKDGLIAAWYDYKEIKLGANSVCLFHFSISSWHKQSHGSWHCFGHSHGGHTQSRGKMLDVGLDSAYNIYGVHKFFSEQDIEAYMQTKQVFIADQHRTSSQVM